MATFIGNTVHRFPDGDSQPITLFHALRDQIENNLWTNGFPICANGLHASWDDDGSCFATILASNLGILEMMLQALSKCFLAFGKSTRQCKTFHTHPRGSPTAIYASRQKLINTKFEIECYVRSSPLTRRFLTRVSEIPDPMKECLKPLLQPPDRA